MKRKLTQDEIDNLNFGRIYYNYNDLNIFIR